MHCPSPQLALASLLPLTSVSGGSLHFPPGALLTAYIIVGPTKYHACMLCAQCCLAVCHPMVCSPLSFSVHGISQARILEWVAISSSRGSSLPKDRTRLSCVSCISGRILDHWQHLVSPTQSTCCAMQAVVGIKSDNALRFGAGWHWSSQDRQPVC